MDSLAARTMARSRALWLVVAVCLWVHPLLLQLHEVSDHACSQDHGHAPASVPENPGSSLGPADHGGGSPCGAGTHGVDSPETCAGAFPGERAELAAAAEPNADHASADLTAADDAAAQASADPATADATAPADHHGPGQHCFHCVLCYAAGHAAQAAPLPVALEVALESRVTVEPGEIHGPRAASLAPAAPRAPPSLS